MSTRRIEEACERVASVDPEWLAKAQSRQVTLTKPPGSLGRLEEVGNRIGAITRMDLSHPIRKRMYVVAADHGVTAEGVSAYPREVTYQMVFNFLRGGAAINVLARHGDIEVQVVDAGVDHDFKSEDRLLDRKIFRGSANFALGPAMTREEAKRSIAIGIDLAETAKADGIKLLGVGEMGIGNTTSASAVTAVLTDSSPEDVTGRGTGIGEVERERKIDVVRRAIELNRPDSNDPVDILAKLGGAELGVMLGLFIGSAADSIPIVADGFISTAASALAIALCPGVRDYLFVAHLSQEPGHRALVKYIGEKPLLDLGMRLGEGTGAALAMHLIEAAARLLTEMATFDDAGVSNKAT